MIRKCVILFNFYKISLFCSLITKYLIVKINFCYVDLSCFRKSELHQIGMNLISEFVSLTSETFVFLWILRKQKILLEWTNRRIIKLDIGGSGLFLSWTFATKPLMGFRKKFLGLKKFIFYSSFLRLNVVFM